MSANHSTMRSFISSCHSLWAPYCGLILAERRTHSQITKMYEPVNHLAPSYLYLLVSRPNQQQYNLRNTRNLIFGTNSMYTNSFFPNAVREYNKFSIDLRQSTIHPQTH